MNNSEVTYTCELIKNLIINTYYTKYTDYHTLSHFINFRKQNKMHFIM